jgi:hypothetical protein
MMPVWISNTELDPTWLQDKLLQQQLLLLLDPSVIITKASIQDISNDTRKGETPKDGATLKVFLTMTRRPISSDDKSGTKTKTTGDDDASSSPPPPSLLLLTLPDTLVIKQNTGGDPLSLSLGLAREALFYKHLAPKVKDVAIPKIYYSHGDWTTGEKVVVMEDLSSSKGSGSNNNNNNNNNNSFIDSGILFGPGNPNNWNRDLKDCIAKAYHTNNDEDGAQQPPSAEQVAHATFQAIAKVHATFWKDATLLEDHEWLRGANWVQGKDEASWEASQGYIQGIYQAGIDDSVQWDPLVKATIDHAMAGISWGNQLKRLNTNENTHWTLVHGDFWPGNILVSTKDCNDLRMLDWEMTGLGSGPQDLGQYVLSNMDVQERRDCEERLVKDYYDELVRNGVENLTWEECWNEYRIGGVERWLWFLVYFCGQQGPLLKWAQFFHDQIAAFLKDHDLKPSDFVQPRP